MQLDELLKKPLWQMTGEEFLFLQNSSLQGANYVPAPVAETSKKRYEYGIRGIAKIFGCSIPTPTASRKAGRLMLPSLRLAVKSLWMLTMRCNWLKTKVCATRKEVSNVRTHHVI